MKINDYYKIAEDQRKYYSDLSNIISFDKFTTVIKNSKDLLDFIGDSACGSPLINIVKGKTYILNSRFLLSSCKTLDSIVACCKLGSFADANTLIRKYKEDLFLYLYIIEVSNNRKILTDQEYGEIIGEMMTEEKFLEFITIAFNIIYSGVRKEKHDKVVDAWFGSTAQDVKFYKTLNIKNYVKYLEKNELVKDCLEKHDLKKIWRDLTRKQNNYVHSNGSIYLIDNYISFDELERLEYLLKNIHNDISFITSLFLIILILIKPLYISAYDYIYYMEEGLEPPEDSQYWIASIVQEYIDDYIKNLHPDLKKFLKDKNPYGMMIM